jgi:hypothetical protein
MSPKKIVCAACGVEATRAYVDGKPSLDLDDGAFERYCVGRRIEPDDPFRCPNMLSAAIDASLVGNDGRWIE